MKMNILRICIALLIVCAQSHKTETACKSDVDTSSSTNISAYKEGYDVGTANQNQELYLLPESQNPCAKYAKQCTKFSACKDGFKDGSNNKPSNPPTN